MDQAFLSQSLLPWLDAGSSKIYLEFSLQSDSSQVHSHSSSPFKVVDASAPLARLVRGVVTAGPGKTLKDVFLLLPKDRYSFTEKNIPLNNIDIETMWQEAACRDGAGTVLGGVALWKPLFYCIHQTCYFHPPCPKCGKELELCCRDELLAASQLPNYSSTLQRFLFCPACHQTEMESAFYAYESGADHPAVKDRWALIRAFADLAAGDVIAPDFPCATCADRQRCFETEKLAASRITPFSFYPFPMLFCDAGQLHAVDFLALISGAMGEEVKTQPDVLLEAGRRECVEAVCRRAEGGITLFFENDSRIFLEILFLKLAFLQQISTTFLKTMQHMRHADLRLSLDQFWVNFSDHDGLLPLFWNFQLIPMTIGIAPPRDDGFVSLPQSLALHSLALVWFSSLLANSKQSAVHINHALSSIIEDIDEENALDFTAPFVHNEMRVFDPVNIFWLPADEDIPEQWRILWQKALGIGWALLLSSRCNRQDFSDDVFVRQVNSLAAEVKGHLFAAEPAVQTAAETAQAKAVSVETDKADIHDILISIRDKWQAASLFDEQEKSDEAEFREPSAPIAATEPEEEELEETVMLNINALASSGISPLFKAPPVEEKASVVTGEKEAAPESQPISEYDEELEETVMINLKQLEELRNKTKDDR